MTTYRTQMISPWRRTSWWNNTLHKKRTTCTFVIVINSTICSVLNWMINLVKIKTTQTVLLVFYSIFLENRNHFSMSYTKQWLISGYIFTTAATAVVATWVMRVACVAYTYIYLYISFSHHDKLTTVSINYMYK